MTNIRVVTAYSFFQGSAGSEKRWLSSSVLRSDSDNCRQCGTTHARRMHKAITVHATAEFRFSPWVNLRAFTPSGHRRGIDLRARATMYICKIDAWALFVSRRELAQRSRLCRSSFGAELRAVTTPIFHVAAFLRTGALNTPVISNCAPPSFPWRIPACQPINIAARSAASRSSAASTSLSTRSPIRCAPSAAASRSSLCWPISTPRRRRRVEPVAQSLMPR